ncbi:hypothetical protein Poli38472_006754 [Pythium oligandrum]|uniref:Nonsense-mediated mRNA decay factor SMG8 n=1 Tax=Pythium oligandrum TaxID=41045 RepID=A0A8K1FDC5_PYTOL|nr:hypothetical protein Poli38472_006754 [Pythium oligandrum]|eukprot:TMW56744.1 hypothetical protein Poli38472_006754 [Pythium oligandrum]
MPSGRRPTPRHHASPPLPPPTVPPLEDLCNEPVRIYPAERTRGASPASAAAKSPGKDDTADGKLLLQSLLAVSKPVAIVGFLGAQTSTSQGLYTFVNRVIGRVAFMDENADDSALGKTSPLLASIQLFYDESRAIAYLVGVTKPEGDVLKRVLLGDGHTDPREAATATLTAYQREKLKMELLLYSCCNLVFHYNESGRVTTNILKQIRQLAIEKQQVLAQLATGSSKNTKQREKGSGVVNVFAPGRCVPLVLFVVPAPEELFQVTSKQVTSMKSRSSTVAFCKAQEATLCTLFRSLRGGLVGSLRSRDAVTPTNLSKERRLFHVDPSHCVVVVSKKASSDEGRVERRFESVLDQLPWDLSTMEQPWDLDALLKPLEEDDIGFPNAIQQMNRFVESVFHASSSSTNDRSNKEINAKVELLTLSQWLKAFQSLVKTMHRVEAKKKQEMDIGNDRENTRLAFDHIDLRS